MRDMPRKNREDRWSESRPHWLWALVFIVAPFTLITIGVLGIAVGSIIPFGLAETAPKVAVVMSFIGMAVSLRLRRRVLIAIAAIGLTISVGGLLMLLWVT